MFGEKHDLNHELPEHKDRIHELKVSNEHFKDTKSLMHAIESSMDVVLQNFRHMTPLSCIIKILNFARFQFRSNVLPEGKVLLPMHPDQIPHLRPSHLLS